MIELHIYHLSQNWSTHRTLSTVLIVEICMSHMNLIYDRSPHGPLRCSMAENRNGVRKVIGFDSRRECFFLVPCTFLSRAMLVPCWTTSCLGKECCQEVFCNWERHLGDSQSYRLQKVIFVWHLGYRNQILIIVTLTLSIIIARTSVQWTSSL